MRIWNLFFFFITFLPNTLIAQDDFKQQVKVEMERGSKPPTLIPLGEQGFIIFRIAKNKEDNNKDLLVFTRYTSNLEFDWETSIALSKKVELSLHDFEGDFLYLIFHDSKNEMIQVLKIQPDEGTFESYNFNILRKIDFRDFAVLNEKIFITGLLKKAPVVLRLDPKTNNVRMLPTAFKGRPIEIQEISADWKYDRVSLNLRTRINNSRGLVIRTYDERGDIESDFLITPTKTYDLLNGKLKSKNRTSYVVGTYSLPDKNSAQGFFISNYQNEKLIYDKYYSFTDLVNFFNFMEGDKADKMEETVIKLKLQGRELKTNFRYILHDIIFLKNQFVFVAEAYTPVFRNQSYFDFYAEIPDVTRGVEFAGYKFSHVVAVGFNRQGIIQWNNTFKIHGVSTYYLSSKVVVNNKNGLLEFSYASENKVYKTVIGDGEILKESVNENDVEDNAAGDPTLNRTVYWYDNYFLSWGLESQSEENFWTKRNVYYINKLTI